MKEMVLSHEQARAAYDRIGRFQDAQAFYEDAAVRDLIAHADFEHARSVVEFGCGTGRHAARLLAETLPEGATYIAVDQSATMIALAERRLAPFAPRARVQTSDGAASIPVGDSGCDRILSTYVFDLLSENDVESVIADAHRALEPAGRLCLVSLTHGRTVFQKLMSGGFERLFRWRPALVGGCRPIEIEPFLRTPAWEILYSNVVSPFGLPSEVVVARPVKE